ncbi:hypothetical protein D918_03842 [Trichuris suis]|nr:hypothetical protein D918_03842 [Trichuris suis]
MRLDDSCECPICGEVLHLKNIDEHFEQESKEVDKTFARVKSSLEESCKIEESKDATCDDIERNSNGRYEIYCRVQRNRQNRLREQMAAFRYCSQMSPCESASDDKASNQCSNEDDCTRCSSVGDSKWSPSSSQNSYSAATGATEGKQTLSSPFPTANVDPVQKLDLIWTSSLHAMNTDDVSNESSWEARESWF